MTFCVYVHMKPDMTPFYVGKGKVKDRRAYDLRLSRRNIWHARVLEKIGVQNVIIETMPCSSEKEAFFRERTIIAALRDSGVQLCNMTNGGEGPSGLTLSESARKKVGDFHRGRKRSFETRTKISESNKGRKNSEEAKKRMAIARIGRKLSKEHRENIGKGHLGFTHSDATKRKLSIASTGRTASKEAREKMSKIHAGKEISQEMRDALSRANTGKVWCNDGTSSRHVRPEVANTLLADGWLRGRCKK